MGKCVCGFGLTSDWMTKWHVPKSVITWHGKAKQKTNADLGVANVPSKTMGLAKIFAELRGSCSFVFKAVMCISQSHFFSQSCLTVSSFFEAKKVTKYRFVN